jgi:uncharacterized repeat protein (TIGR01451 family)
MSFPIRHHDPQKQTCVCKKSFLLTKLNTSLLFALLSSGSPSLMAPSLAAPVLPLPVGTPIENQATGSYVDTLNFDSTSIESNVVTVKIGEIAGVIVTAAGNSGTVSAGNTTYFSYVITNIGNDATQFYLPGNATITGNATQNGNIQITGHNINGTTPVTLAAASYVNVPLENVLTGSTINGFKSGDALALDANGVIQPGGSVTIRVPVQINTNAAVDDVVTVLFGDTPIDTASTTTPKARVQNQAYIDEKTDQKYDVYTVDNPNGTTGEYDDPPLNGDLTNHRQEASAIQKATVIGVDYGDAPDAATGTGTGNYQTTLSDGGSSHIIVPGLSIGTKVDSDSSLLQNANADADDTSVTSSNDEDGVTSFSVLNTDAARIYTVAVKVTNTTNQPAYLVGYIDFNQNGDFSDTTDKSATITVPANAGTNNYNVTFTTPAGMAVGNSYARFRLSSTQTEAESSIGAAASGEVEDYKLSIVSSYTPGSCQPDGLVWASGGNIANNRINQIGNYRISNSTFTNIATTTQDWGDIGWGSDNKLYGVEYTNLTGAPNKQSALYQIDTTTGQTTLIADLSVLGKVANSLSGLPNGGLLIGGDFNSKVYRYELSNSANPPALWHDFGTGFPSGDFILFNNKIYIAWNSGSAESLYEVTVNANYDYVSHRDLGALPPGSRGLALVLNKLYITSNTNIYRIAGIPSNPITTIPITTVPNMPTPYFLGGATGTEEPFGGCSPVIDPNVLLVKRITQINGKKITTMGNSLTTYIDEPSNPYDDNNPTILTRSLPSEPPKDTDKWPTPLDTFLIGGVDGGNVKPGDKIEYTIYFLSAGADEATNVLFCDRVPSNVTFISAAFNSDTPKSSGSANESRGVLALINGNPSDIPTSYTNVADGDAVRYFPAGSDPTKVKDYEKINCGGPNDNGAVVVNLGNLPKATAPANPSRGSYGFVRFQGLVK